MEASAATYPARAASRPPALFGRVLALVALTVGFATLGVWAAREWGGAGWFIATALFVGGLGAGGYAVRRDLAFLYQIAFWMLLALIIAGIVVIVIHIPAVYTAWSLVGLGVFAPYTIADFNRLRHAGNEEAIPLAAGIFLDVLNVFLIFLRLFARSS